MSKKIYAILIWVVIMLMVWPGSLAMAQEGQETWLKSPVKGAGRCGAPFGAPNSLGGQAFHNAIDMACGMKDSDVLSVAGGKVVWADYWPKGGVGGPNTGHGLTVIIYHQKAGVYTYAAHLGSSDVKAGDEVNKGDVIGKVGNSGYVPDPFRNGNYHLHFAVRTTGPDDGACWNTSCWKDPDKFLGKAISESNASRTTNPQQPVVTTTSRPRSTERVKITKSGGTITIEGNAESSKFVLLQIPLIGENKFKVQSLKDWNDHLAKMYPGKKVCVFNGAYFGGDGGQSLSFVVKVDGKQLTKNLTSLGLWDKSIRAVLNLYDGHMDILPLTQENVDKAQDGIGSQLVHRDAKNQRSRTTVGIADGDGDGRYEKFYVQIIPGETATNDEAIASIKKAGAQKVIAFDSGGSTQLICNDDVYVYSSRPIPQAIGIVYYEGGQITTTSPTSPPNSPVTQSPNNSTPKKNGVPRGSWRLIETLDDIFRAISVVPSLKHISDGWDKVRKFVPWILAGITIMIGYVILRFLGGITLMTKWGQKQDRKKKQFFWLAVLELVLYLAYQDPLYLMLFKFTAGIWLFFWTSGWIYRIWRHFNYDPEIEESIRNGGTDNYEWLREAVLVPALLGVLAMILAYVYGYCLFPSQEIRANEPTPVVQQQPSPTPTPGPAPTTPTSPNGNIEWNCNFDAIKAGLGPVKVGCDENGLPTFPIRWWNGNMFQFKIPMRIWQAALGAGKSPNAVIGIIDFGAAESTGFVNHQSENYAGAAGVWQFLAPTFATWAPAGYKDQKFRLDEGIAALAVGKMQTEGMRTTFQGQEYAIYDLSDQRKFESCFQGGGGCSTWNRHADQANYAWRLMVALRVASGQ